MRRALPLVRELGCALTEDELAEQRDRARSLVPHLAEATRIGDGLRLRFGEGADRAVLRTLIETEGRCCPFFEIEHDARAGIVEISVARESDRPALDALAALFTE